MRRLDCLLAFYLTPADTIEESLCRLSFSGEVLQYRFELTMGLRRAVGRAAGRGGGVGGEKDRNQTGAENKPVTLVLDHT